MIQLTSAYDRDAIWINPDFILYFHKGDGKERRGNTMIKMLNTDHTFHVVENPDQLDSIIRTYKDLNK